MTLFARKPKTETRVTSYDRFLWRWLRRELKQQGWREVKGGKTPWMVSP